MADLPRIALRSIRATRSPPQAGERRWSASNPPRLRRTICVGFTEQLPGNGRRAMPIQALGYAGFGSSALDDWRQFGTGLVGLQAVERGNSLLAFRMDDRKQRVVIDRSLPEGARFFGWEVADAAALEALAARLEAAQIQVTAEPQTLARP